MTGIHGILLMGTGVIHLIFGLFFKVYRKDWVAFVRNGLWNEVSLDDDRKMAAFWFVIAGPLLLMLGGLLYVLETNAVALPISFGWLLLTTSALGAWMSPKSGFTILLLPQAVFYLWCAYGS